MCSNIFIKVTDDFEHIYVKIDPRTGNIFNYVGKLLIANINDSDVDVKFVTPFRPTKDNNIYYLKIHQDINWL